MGDGLKRAFEAARETQVGKHKRKRERDIRAARIAGLREGAGLMESLAGGVDDEHLYNAYVFAASALTARADELEKGGA